MKRCTDDPNCRKASLLKTLLPVVGVSSLCKGYSAVSTFPKNKKIETLHKVNSYMNIREGTWEWKLIY